ncbi:MAG: hypothetical protein M3Y34_06030, partial [Actinomycetota bacterium]|nr:hypothetical protein [Actinomycetota bacterium]
LEGQSEEDVFGSGDEESGAPTSAEEPEADAEKTASREGPRPTPRPRPGFAGGTEMRADR